MKKVVVLCIGMLLWLNGPALAAGTAAASWISLFDGKTLNGWKANENPATFSVANGAIVVNGLRSHLFYVGAVNHHNFKNFEWKADVMTTPGSNSGMYFHTAFQETGWPAKGYEVQVNNTHADPRKTGGLNAIQDVLQAPVKDNEWFTQHIIVQGKRIIVKVNGKTLVDYTEPENAERPKDLAGRLLSSGTFALQGHDPKSKVYFKNIMVKVLPDK
ncbi:MAG: DUF1080 domain-containing protein [Acidobacteria bacterium]|nr:DUF1080 domain-containing protein [Acidobacteriota bacterium]